ncbi:MAG: hypothetical protein HYV37_01465 [Candidatus Levyibacteriota bacterium]|nr:MAG: hypothetical protein HYV37_01465 [Candidatus Levybacteria bacterium]
MGSNISKNILKTILYSDLFDYPLTIDEISYFLINDRKIPNQRIKEYIQVSSFLVEKNGYICLRKREFIIKKRLLAKKHSAKKYKVAKKASCILSFIPTISLVGVSGTLAMENVLENDDIDICIVAKKNTLWITRFLATILLDICKMRRKRKMGNVSDKICLNMFIEESALAFPKGKQNLYTAHEVVQMKPLFDRNNTYKKFILANMWVKKFLSNATIRFKIQDLSRSNRDLRFKNKEKNSLFVNHYSLIVLEFLAKKLQLWYMYKHRENEEVGDHFLAFYPFDYAEKVLSRYEEKLRKYHIV